MWTVSVCTVIWLLFIWLRLKFRIYWRIFLLNLWKESNFLPNTWYTSSRKSSFRTEVFTVVTGVLALTGSSFRNEVDTVPLILEPSPKVLLGTKWTFRIEVSFLNEKSALLWLSASWTFAVYSLVHMFRKWVLSKNQTQKNDMIWMYDKTVPCKDCND